MFDEKVFEFEESFDNGVGVPGQFIPFDFSPQVP
jgi:hypothetical protein